MLVTLAAYTALNRQLSTCAPMHSLLAAYTALIVIHLKVCALTYLLAAYTALNSIKRVAIFAKACLGASQPQQAAKTTRPFNASGGPDSPSSPALAPKRLKS